MAEETRKCQQCYKSKPLDENHFRKKARESDGYGKTCIPCTHKRKANYDNKKEEKSKENKAPKAGTDAEEDSEAGEIEELRRELGNISLEKFIDALSATEGIHSIAAFVDISTIDGKNMRERVDKLVKMVWEQLEYRFVYVKYQKSYLDNHINFTIVFTVYIVTKELRHAVICIIVPKFNLVSTSQKNQCPRESSTGIKIIWIAFPAVDGFMSQLWMAGMMPLSNWTIKISMWPTGISMFLRMCRSLSKRSGS